MPPIPAPASPLPPKSEFRFADDHLTVHLRILQRGQPSPREDPPDRITSPPDEPNRIEPTHSTDFASVRWFDGHTYYFTGTQRLVVAHLWEAMEAGAPAVDQHTLLEVAESESRRLSDLFRGSPAWGVVIVRGALHGAPVGSYQLAPRD